MCKRKHFGFITCWMSYLITFCLVKAREMKKAKLNQFQIEFTIHLLHKVFKLFQINYLKMCNSMRKIRIIQDFFVNYSYTTSIEWLDCSFVSGV